MINGCFQSKGKYAARACERAELDISVLSCRICNFITKLILPNKSVRKTLQVNAESWKPIYCMLKEVRLFGTEIYVILRENLWHKTGKGKAWA